MSAHLYEEEMPRGYESGLCPIVKRGVANALESEDVIEPAAKRQRVPRG